MQFAALPPEINSGLMYTGPGSGPMLAAAAAWDGLSGELRSVATGYESVISGLTSQAWLGPSSAVMSAAAAPYLGWLVATASLAEQTATQARAAAAAYETAFAMTVAPPVIAANRAQLATLVATNIFGQNTAAIAANEAQYAQMWAQDAAAMHAYAGSAAVAAELTPFTPPPRTASGDGQSGQAAALARAVGHAATTAMAAAAQSAQAPTAPSLSSLVPVAALAVGMTTAGVNPSIAGAAWNAAATNSRLLLRNTNEILDNHQVLIDSEDEILRVESEILGVLSGRAPAAGVPASAGLARAVSVGKLSVPLNWAVAAPEIRTVAYTLPTAPAAVAALADSPATAFSQMALAGMGGSALAGSVSRGRGEYVGAKTGERVQVIADEPVEEPSQDSPMTEIVIGIRQLSELRDSGLLTAREFDEQKQRLLELPLRSALPQ